MARGKDDGVRRVVEDADPYDAMRRKISQRAAEGVGPYDSLAAFARQGQSPARRNASIQKRGHIMASLLSFYLKSCASCRTISFTFMRRTFVEDSFSSSFMVM